MASLPPAYFDALYARESDPWRFETSPYEAEKYAATLAALPRPTYADALEVGCSIGVLSASLADRCDRLFATDVAEAALARARLRTAERRNVQFERQRFPYQVPAQCFDLIVLSEVLYYLDLETLREAAGVVLKLARPGADILLVHWLGETPDYPLDGNSAADGFMAAAQDWAAPLSHLATPQYRIDLLRRNG